ncbi:MAG: AAA family ATPase [Nitriliruptorales bacterium]|nr:AAA family ATPase [Nitriliruptorales bacterium]
MATETASVLFTDIVASTELRSRLGEERADELRKAHDDAQAAAVDGAGGKVVKGLGDGIMAVFASAADAVAAAVDIQHASERLGREIAGEPLALRVGISVGDVLFEDDDYFGTAVVEASRLCAAAQGGQILVADLARALTRGRGGFQFESMGELELKGLDDPVAASFVVWEPLVVGDSEAEVPFPSMLASTSQIAYTGRLGLLADLRKSWDLVSSGEGSRPVLLVGEPGVGKTRTASELARGAHEAGAMVLYGRCDEELGLSYEPFVEALDWQTAHAPARALGRFPGDLRRLVPDLDARIDGLPAAIKSDARAEEHRLLEATASWLAEASRDTGLVLVVDDLHWATRPTLQMLLHVARTAAGDDQSKLLIVATYRDTDVDRAHPLSSVLGDLRRLPNVERLSVDPLSEAEVIELVAEAAGHELDETTRELARRAYAETEGNPFFVGEVLRHFIETAVVRFDEGRWVVTDVDRVDVPEGVRDVIGRRLNRLSERANEVLTIGAVAGREFPLDIISSVSGASVDEILDVLDEALRARLIEESGADRFRFAHALTRQTLYEELSATRLRRLHRKIVEVLERLRPTDVVTLAHHSVEAGPVGGDLSGAIRYSLAAGDQALDRRAIGDADRYFKQALELIEDTTDPDPAWQLHARCGLGEVLRDSGDQAFRQHLLEVTQEAVAAGELDIAVRAALANGRIILSIVGAVDEERVAQLEAVLAALGDGDRAERPLLLATLASELSTDPTSVDRRLALADEATDLARASGDPALLARVLAATGNAVNIPRRLPELMARVEEGVAAAEAAGDPTLKVIARFLLAFVLQQHGRLDEARDCLLEAKGYADRECNPIVQWMAASFVAQYAGGGDDVAAVRAAAAASLEQGQQLGEPDAVNWWGAVELGLRYAEGTMDELVDLLDAMAEQFAAVVGWRLSKALVLAESGPEGAAEASRIIDEHGFDRPEGIPEDLFAHAYLGLHAEVIRQIDRRDVAERFLPVVEADAEWWATNGVTVYNPMVLSVACHRVVTGDHGGAEEAALASWDLIVSGPRIRIPSAALVVGEILQRVGSAHARERARPIVAHGLADAEAMGMDRRTEQLRALLAELD